MTEQAEGTRSDGADPRGVAVPPKSSDLLLREAEHRFLNVMQMMIAVLRSERRRASTEEARASLTCVLELTETLAALQRETAWSQTPDMAVRLETMAQHWQRLCNGSIEVRLDAQRDLGLAPAEIAIAILIVQELVLNAIKHAFPDGRHGTIRVILRREAGQFVLVSVEDDGIGTLSSTVRSDDADRPHGSSLMLSLAALLGGDVEEGRGAEGSGHRVTLRWPE